MFEPFPLWFVIALGATGIILVLVSIYLILLSQKRDLKKICRNTLFGIIPSPRAYLNFMLIWVFFLLTYACQKGEPVVVLVSGFATLYFMNEWLKEVWRDKTWKKKS